MTIDTEPGGPEFAVHRWVPSKAMPTGLFPRLLAATVTATGGSVGSITYRLPGDTSPATKILPAATKTPSLPVAPVQVPSTLPVLAWTWITWLSPKLDIQMALPSTAQYCGVLPTAIVCIAATLC